MKGKDTKELLITTSMDLLRNSEDINNVTVRDIIGKAGVNVSMINYHFGSKDELIKIALLRLIEEKANDMVVVCNNMEDPRVALFQYLNDMTESVLSTEKYTRAIMPAVLLKDPIAVPEYIVPLISACFHGSRPLQECRLIAFEIITFLQMIFYRMHDFSMYTGIDINDKDTRSKLISDQLDIFIGKAI